MVQPIVPRLPTIEMATSISVPSKKEKLSITVACTEVAKADFNITAPGVMTAIESFSVEVDR